MMSLDRNMLCTKIWSFFLFSILILLEVKTFQNQKYQQLATIEKNPKRNLGLKRVEISKKMFFGLFS
jgi:hypothetical protein